MKKLFLLFILIINLSFVSDRLVYKYSIPLKNDFFTFDNIGNLYIVKGDGLSKLNNNKKINRVYSNKRLGKISHVDVSNPLRILVFYKEFSAVVFLDSQLSQNGEIVYLENYDLEQSDLSCTSFNNGLWVYSRQNAELIRLDNNLTINIKTGNLNQLLGLRLNPNFILESNGYIYLVDQEDGIILFDIYGNYYKKIPIKKATKIQVNENSVFAVVPGKLISYHSKYLTQDTLLLPMENCDQVQVFKDEFFIGMSDSISVFTKK